MKVKCPHPQCDATYPVNPEAIGVVPCICKACNVLVQWEDSKPIVTLASDRPTQHHEPANP